MSDPRADRRAYLDRVSSRLGLPPASQADVLEELDVHIAESVAGLCDEGLSPELAEREALARLGDPGELAEGIRHARQTRRRLVLATGYGVWAAVGGAVWGYLFAFGVVAVAGVLSWTVMSVLVQRLGIATSGWETPSAILSIPFGAFAAAYAGRRVPPAVARRSERSVREVARPIALLGGLGLASVTIFAVRIALDDATVAILLLLPVGFAVGAWTARDSDVATGRVRLRGRWVVAAILATTLVLTSVAVLSLGKVDEGPWTDPTFERIGPPASDVLGAPSVGTSSTWMTGAPLQLELTSEPTRALAGWRDLRLEAWRAVDARGRVDPSAASPAVTVPLIAHDGGWSGTLEPPVSKQRAWFLVVTTGVAPDGRRYVLSGPDGPAANRSWVGTVWEWFTTP